MRATVEARPSSGFSIDEATRIRVKLPVTNVGTAASCAWVRSCRDNSARFHQAKTVGMGQFAPYGMYMAYHMHTMSHLSWLLLALLYPLGAWAEGPLGHSLKLQAASLVYIGSPVAAKVPHICLLAQPASKLDRPLDPGCSPQEPQPAWVHDLCFMSTWMQFLLLGISTPLVHG